MASKIILECAQPNGVLGPEAPWTSTFSTTILLAESDVVQVKTALINTQSASSSNLVFESDQDLVITVGYYYVIAPVIYSRVVHDSTTPFIPYLSCYGNNADPHVKFATNSGPAVGVASPVSGCYILRKPASTDLFTTDFKFTIPKSLYSPDAITTLLTEGLYNARSTTATGDQSLGVADQAGVFIDPLDLVPRDRKFWHIQ